ncbi:alpha/beta fold hydrolase [Oleiagrimonas soli]|uniref:Hydrolase n=1 Tax=Oleiagrimonas soli TaxID=1543381 RepID=A0A099D123_9GAMM|nr:alpha/beta hydrolase [Oleiagrimonas soli]KGI78980.1 hydrolase [Oleiagrimonas soli]MBB6184497.1 pimeloyl-ACP methyl ester carboxylesterase [Oleiagrimonas soli]
MPQWVRDVCTANNIDISYLRTGGDKPPLVLLHGLIASGACWTPVARTLESEYDVVMPDARGHGGSSAPDRGYGYENHAGDVIGLIQSLGLTSPVLIGHSMGGMTTALAASRTCAMLRGVVLVDPTFLSAQRQVEVFESDVAEQHRRQLGRDRRELVDELRERHPHRSQEIIEYLADARLRTHTEAFEVLRPPKPDYRQLIHTIGIPVLLITAESGIVTTAMADELQRLNARVRVEAIPGAGHGVLYDKPEQVASLVRTFLAAR